MTSLQVKLSALGNPVFGKYLIPYILTPQAEEGGHKVLKASRHEKSEKR